MFWSKKWYGLVNPVKIDPELLPYYERAGSEIATKQCHQGLLAQAYSECEGSVERTHARYIELRVQFLKLEAEQRRVVEMENEKIRARHEEIVRKQREVEEAEARIRAEAENPEKQEKGGMLVTSVETGNRDIMIGDVVIMCNGVDIRGNKGLFSEIQKEAYGASQINVVLIREKRIVKVLVNRASLRVGFVQLAG